MPVVKFGVQDVAIATSEISKIDGEKGTLIVQTHSSSPCEGELRAAPLGTALASGKE